MELELLELLLLPDEVIETGESIPSKWLLFNALLIFAAVELEVLVEWGPVFGLLDPLEVDLRADVELDDDDDDLRALCLLVLLKWVLLDTLLLPNEPFVFEEALLDD